MKWAWKIGTLSGIGVYVHATFLILLLWVGTHRFLITGDLTSAFRGILFIIALFGCVVLHELGHALTARRFGIRTRDIILLPIGGVARLERMPDNPMEELLVAFAGPAVNAVIAVALYLFLRTTEGLLQPYHLDWSGSHFLNDLMWVNLSLIFFNLLPAFPMDGGRVLRAFLAFRMDYVRATHIAANIGQGMAFVFGFLGLLYNPFLLFIALFVWMAAAEEASLVQIRNALWGIPTRLAMITDFRSLSPEDSISRAIEYLLSGFQQDFPVVEDNRVVGVLTREDLLRALATGGLGEKVSSFMRRNFVTAEAEEMLEKAIQRLQECDCPSLPVLSQGRLVGILTSDNLGEFLMIRSALDSSARWPRRRLSNF